MGGCRCSFRDCKVSSYNQIRMHFFRFPLKDIQRYSKWRQYAKKEEMLNYSIMKQKNTVVCGRHFRPECFMNYKLDRLTASAVPTLTRLSETRALDFELDMECGVLVKLEKPTLKHLIAPQNYECVLNLNADDNFLEKCEEPDMELERVTENVPVQIKTPTSKQNTNEFSYELSNWENNEIAIETTSKSTSNVVHILETIQLSASHAKRPREDATTSEDTNINKKQILSDDVIYTNVPSTSQSFENLAENQVKDEEENLTFSDEVDEAGNDDCVELFEIQNDSETQDHFEENNHKTSIVNEQDNHTLMEIMKTNLLEDQNEISLITERLIDAKVFEVKVSNLEKENLELKEKLKENENLKIKLISSQKENSRLKNSIKVLENIKEKLQKNIKEMEKLNQSLLESDTLKAKTLSQEKGAIELNNSVTTIEATYSTDTNDLKKQLELELEQQHDKYLKTGTRLQQYISTLIESLEISKQQISTTKNQLSTTKANLNELQLEKLNLSKQNMNIEQNLQMLENNYDTLDQEHICLQSKYDCLQQKHSNLEKKYLKLETLQNQVATVTTSLDNTLESCPSAITAAVSQPSANTLTKAQLFNSIKRYVSVSMASLLRMEMFGSSEREWKQDERLVAVDLLRLGETVYKFITDEWRFRLPALRDVRNWLSQSVEIDDEEDL